MTAAVHGKIVSINLGEFSRKRIKYGYIGIELPDKTHMKLKVDSYTWYETLEIGNEVIIEFEDLGGTGIHVARKIQLSTSIESSPDEVSATV
ncbi:MAG: hypothetical protein ACFFFK_04960 [Candidatus Thorarchaeota archaeon]